MEQNTRRINEMKQGNTNVKRILIIAILIFVIVGAILILISLSKEKENSPTDATTTEATPTDAPITGSIDKPSTEATEVSTTETTESTTEAQSTTEATKPSTETSKPTTEAPTTQTPATSAPASTEAPKPSTTEAPATHAPTTEATKPSTEAQPTTEAPTTSQPTTEAPKHNCSVDGHSYTSTTTTNHVDAVWVGEVHQVSAAGFDFTANGIIGDGAINDYISAHPEVGGGYYSCDVGVCTASSYDEVVTTYTCTHCGHSYSETTRTNDGGEVGSIVYH